MRNPRRNPTRRMFAELKDSGVRFKLKHQPGEVNAAGTKLIVRSFKAKHGIKPKTVDDARTWYAGYLAEKDAKVRAAERKRRIARILRNHAWLLEWPTVKAA